MIKLLKWLIWVCEGNAPEYYRYRWYVFKSQVWYQWRPQLLCKLGLMTMRTAPSVVKLMTSRYGLSYRVESAKELVDLNEENKQKARIKNAEDFEMTHCSKRSYGYNKNFFHRNDPGMDVSKYMKKQDQIIKG